ncbi:9118_t:CDS:2, partial [Cetraspora pellucida]
KLNYSLGFLKDNYEKPQMLLDIALKDCAEGVYFKEGLVTFNESQELFIQDINSKVTVKLNLKKASYGCGLRLCKKALDIAITNNSNKALEDLLQQFINEQISTLCQNTCEPSEQQLDYVKISNLLQHKDKRWPANKRYLSAIENYNIKNIGSSNQDKTLLTKKNKCQCAMCKSWYHDF